MDLCNISVTNSLGEYAKLVTAVNSALEGMISGTTTFISSITALSTMFLLFAIKKF